MRLALILSFLVLAAPAIAADPPKGQGGASAAIVTVAKVEARDMPVEITTIGRVQTVASVPIRPRIDGLITEARVKDGQAVKAGDVLFMLDDRALQASLRQAEAQLARDRAQLTAASRDVARQTSLSRNNVVSRATVDQSQADAAALEATVAADQALVDLARVQLSYTTITAPIDGQLGTINSKAGTLIRAGDASPLVVLNQISPIYVGFAVSQDNVVRIRAAMAGGTLPVKVTIPGDRGPALHGTLAYIENTIDPASNTLMLNAEFDNDDHRLWPGLFVDAALTLTVEAGAVTVPATAVQAGQKGDYVFVVKDDSTVSLRLVEVGRVVGGTTIIADGLKPGETVVVTGQIRLDDGSRIEVQKPQAPGNPPS